MIAEKKTQQIKGLAAFYLNFHYVHIIYVFIFFTPKGNMYMLSYIAFAGFYLLTLTLNKERM